MHAGNVTEQIEGIRQQTVAVLDELMANAGEFELADPPAAFERYRQKLRENTYKVLVVGEAKWGKKSAFIRFANSSYRPVPTREPARRWQKGSGMA